MEKPIHLNLLFQSLEILIGHWDGYAVNMNNFYLYQRPSDGKFVFIEYDMDNTFGIDWIDVDWAHKNIYFWGESDRPLYQRVMDVPYFRDRFTLYMAQLLQDYFIPANIISELNETQSLITQAALDDPYKELDYGFSNDDFLNAIDLAFGAHVSYSLSDYISTRYSTADFQLEEYLGLEPPCDLGIDNQYMTAMPERWIDLNGKAIKDINSFRGMYIIVYSNGLTKKQVR